MLIPVAACLAGLYALALSYRGRSHERRTKRRLLRKPLPTVTALIPSYRSETTLPKTLDSLRSQDYPLKEIIVVNDGPRGNVPDNTCYTQLTRNKNKVYRKTHKEGVNRVARRKVHTVAVSKS